MIRPVLEYGDVLYDNCPAYLGQQLEKVQRQAALICTGGYKHTDYKNLLKELNWQSLSDRRKLHKLVIFYKIKNNIYPGYLSKFLNQNQNSNYNLRNTRNLRPRYSRLQKSINSYFPSTVRLWNNLSRNTQESPSVNNFKALVRGPNIYNPYHRLCSSKPGIWLTRLRLGLSALNQHRFKYNFIDSPDCPNCPGQEESTQHYLFKCQSYILARNQLYQKLYDELGVDTQNEHELLSVILEGETINIKNCIKLQTIIYEFFINSKRFI